MKYVDVKNQRMTIAPKPEKKKSGLKYTLMVLVIMMLLAGALVFFSRGSKALFDPISIVASVSAADLKQTDGRTNVLVLGMDRRDFGAVHSVLTDTIIVASIGKVENDVVLISLPRDLWVDGPTQGFSKINAVYTYGQQMTPPRGAEDLQKVVSDVLGIPIHYYVVVDFDIFKETIDALGGINVNVATAFEDIEYPLEGKEDDNCGRTSKEIEEMQTQPITVVFPCRYQHLKFEAGEQVMNGDTALKFARSRHGNNNEGTDFARAKRQQEIITAVKNKALSAGTLLNPAKIKELYDTYSKNVDTNIDFGTMQAFYQLSQQANFSNIKSIVFDDRSSAEVGGLLYAPTDTSLYGGAYVLRPRAGDFSQIHAYVQRYLFGSN